MIINNAYFKLIYVKRFYDKCFVFSCVSGCGMDAASVARPLHAGGGPSSQASSLLAIRVVGREFLEVDLESELSGCCLEACTAGIQLRLHLVGGVLGAFVAAHAEAEVGEVVALLALPRAWYGLAPRGDDLVQECTY